MSGTAAQAAASPSPFPPAFLAWTPKWSPRSAHSGEDRPVQEGAPRPSATCCLHRMGLSVCLGHFQHSPACTTPLSGQTSSRKRPKYDPLGPNNAHAGCHRTFLKDGRLTGLGTASFEAELEAGSLAFCTDSLDQHPTAACREQPAPQPLQGSLSLQADSCCMREWTRVASAQLEHPDCREPAYLGGTQRDQAGAISGCSRVRLRVARACLLGGHHAIQVAVHILFSRLRHSAARSSAALSAERHIEAQWPAPAAQDRT